MLLNFAKTGELEEIEKLLEGIGGNKKKIIINIKDWRVIRLGVCSRKWTHKHCRISEE